MKRTKIKEMINKRLKYWYLNLITGGLLIALGIYIMRTPVASFLSLAWLISLGLLFSGVSETIYSISNRKNMTGWEWHLTGGVITFLLGLHLSIRPELTAIIICYYIGFWVLFRSIMYIGTSIKIKDSGSKNWGLLLTLSVLGVLISFILLWNPTITSVAISYWMGIGLLLLGLVQISLAFILKKVKGGLKSIREKKNNQEFTDYEVVENIE